MGILNLIIAVFVIVVIAMTAIAYPIESIAYGKCVYKTGGKVVKYLFLMFKDKVEGYGHSNNNSTNVG